MAEIFVNVEQMFPMLDGPKEKPITSQSLNQTLLLTDSVHNTPYVAALIQHLLFSQAATIHRSIYNVAINQSLTMSAAADTKPWQRTQQYIVFHQVITLGASERVEQIFVPIQSVSTFIGKLTTSAIVFTQLVHKNIIKVLATSHTVGYKQGASYYKIGLPTRYTFAVTHGPNDLPEVA